MVTDYRLFLPEIVELSKYTTQLITFWRDNSISGRTVSVPVCELESSVLCSSLEVVYYTSVILCAPFSLCWSNHRSWCSGWKQLCFFSFLNGSVMMKWVINIVTTDPQCGTIMTILFGGAMNLIPMRKHGLFLNFNKVSYYFFTISVCS